MNLVLDIGNTRTKVALFSGKSLREKAVWTSWTFGELLEFTKGKKIRNAILSSVQNRDEVLIENLKSKFNLLELSHETPLPFENLYQTPATLGKDRLASVAGAKAIFPGKNVLVVDCGTCIKYEFLTACGQYLGGNIAPGASMRLKAMSHFTAKLPEAGFRLPENEIGQSTETALQNGGLLGAVLEIEGFARIFKNRFKNGKVILTGGDADFFAKYLKIKQLTIEPNLVLIGLNQIQNHQKPKTQTIQPSSTKK